MINTASEFLVEMQGITKRFPGVLALDKVDFQLKPGEVVLVGFDTIPAVLKGIKAGDVDATVRQDPERMGKEGMELLVRHLQGGETPAHVQISAEIIDKTNVILFITK